jgi:hypothetical protein
MTVDPNSIDLPAFMAEHLQRASPICSAACCPNSCRR